MNFVEQLEEENMLELVRYRSGTPQDAVAFTGTVRKHPYDRDKCLLLADLLPQAPASSSSPHAERAGGGSALPAPAILEFRKADVLGMEELASPVDESGQPRQLLRIWIRRGSPGLRYEPFEVDEPLRFLGAARIRDHVLSGSRP